MPAFGWRPLNRLTRVPQTGQRCPCSSPSPVNSCGAGVDVLPRDKGHRLPEGRPRPPTWRPDEKARAIFFPPHIFITTIRMAPRHPPPPWLLRMTEIQPSRAPLIASSLPSSAQITKRQIRSREGSGTHPPRAPSGGVNGLFLFFRPMSRMTAGVGPILNLM